MVAADLLAVLETDTIHTFISLLERCSLKALNPAAARYSVSHRQVRIYLRRLCSGAPTPRAGKSLHQETTSIPEVAPAHVRNFPNRSQESSKEQLFPIIRYPQSIEKYSEM